MQLLNGKILAETIRHEIKEQISKLENKPGLAVILVGEDPASHLYVSLKEKVCLEVGINFQKFIFPASATEEELLNKINELNKKNEVNGILVQLPLPNQDTDKIIAAIDPTKDVDGFHPENLRRLEAGEPCLVSPVVLGVMRLIEETGEALSEKKVVLIMSEIFARPFRAILRQADVVSPSDASLKEKTKNSDLIITAVGQPDLLTGEMIKSGAIVIDVGTTRVDKKIVGDVNFSSTEQLNGWLTPVPGGVGPMTVAMLARNVVKTFLSQDKLQP